MMLIKVKSRFIEHGTLILNFQSVRTCGLTGGLPRVHKKTYTVCGLTLFPSFVCVLYFDPHPRTPTPTPRVPSVPHTPHRPSPFPS